MHWVTSNSCGPSLGKQLLVPISRNSLPSSDRPIRVFPLVSRGVPLVDEGMPRSLLPPLLLVFFTLCTTLRADTPWTAFAEGPTLTILDRSGAKALELTPQFWGPDWKFTSVQGSLSAEGETASGTFEGKMGGTDVLFTCETVFDRKGPTQLSARYSLRAEAATDLTLAVVGLMFGQSFEKGSVRVVDGGEEKEITLPVGRSGFGQAVSLMQLTDAEGRLFELKIEPAMPVTSDDAGRIVLASEQLAEGANPSVTLTLTLPGALNWYPTPESVPNPANWEDWFVWKGNGNIPADSALNASDWLEKPAGKHGRIERQADQLVYQGKPITLWGINVCFASTAPPKDLAEKQAKLYASVGINTIRFHKYAGGSGWAGILNGESFTEFDPEKLDRFDYFFAKLKEQGIYVKFSPTFGTFTLGAKDAEKIPFFDELGPMRRGQLKSPAGGAYLSDELRDLQIEQMRKLLAHRNPYTGLTYAEDPAVVVIELLNEQSLLFHTTTRTLQQVPTLRKRAAARFTDWLIERYGSSQAVLERWGDRALNAFKGEGIEGESFEEKSIVPYGNPWFFDPEQLAGSQQHVEARLFDTMLFYYTLQNEFYDAYSEALREAGFEGEIVASNWQAGRAFSHYYNLHSDARIGLIDRHNYFSGTPPMLDRPGGGSLSAGMQQVADLPFMLSEWVHVFPTQYVFEGPAIIGAYGMGLQGWDVSYLFQNRDPGGYLPKLGADKWVFAQPEVLGIFPAISRQVLRQDVKESDLVANRSVHVPSLHEGKLGFDDQVRQGYDDKSFDSKTVPVESIAAVRSVVAFEDEYAVTEPFDLSPYLEGDTIVSSTKELRWTNPEGDHNGYFTIDTAGTKAVVGFAPEEPFELGEVRITPGTSGAAIYLTAVEKEGTLANADRILLTTIARSRNTGMKYLNDLLLSPGEAPIRMEPVKATVRIQREGNPVVHVLDHDGRRTGRTVAVAEDGRFEVDGSATQAVYYEIDYTGETPRQE